MLCDFLLYNNMNQPCVCVCVCVYTPPLQATAEHQAELPVLHVKFGVSASASVLPMNMQDYFPLGWTDWISL